MEDSDKISGTQKQSGVFARSVSDQGGSVGYADIVIHDSPPLTGLPDASTTILNELPVRGLPEEITNSALLTS